MVVLLMPEVKLGKGGPEGQAGRFVFYWASGMSPFMAKKWHHLLLCQGPASSARATSTTTNSTQMLRDAGSGLPLLSSSSSSLLPSLSGKGWSFTSAVQLELGWWLLCPPVMASWFHGTPLHSWGHRVGVWGAQRLHQHRGFLGLAPLQGQQF